MRRILSTFFVLGILSALAFAGYRMLITPDSASAVGEMTAMSVDMDPSATPANVTTAESGGGCTDGVDSDGDGVANDGCPQSGATAETGAQCTNLLNDDSPDDIRVNDGCTTVSVLGSFESCARIDFNGAIDADEDGIDYDLDSVNDPNILEFDVVGQGIPEAFAMVSFSFTMLVRNSTDTATVPGVLDFATANTQLLNRNAGSSLFDTNDAVSTPTASDDGVWTGSGLDTGSVAPRNEHGSGVLSRDSVRALVAGPAIYKLKLTSAFHASTSGAHIVPLAALSHAFVAVDMACPNANDVKLLSQVIETSGSAPFPASIAVNTATPLIVKKSLHNNGPDAVPITVTKTVTLPSDCTLIDDAAVSHGPGGTFDIVRTIGAPTVPVSGSVTNYTESDSITCTLPSAHSVTVVNCLQPVALLADPNTANNCETDVVAFNVTGVSDLKINSQTFNTDPNKCPAIVAPNPSIGQFNGCSAVLAYPPLNPGVAEPFSVAKVIHNNGGYGPTTYALPAPVVTVNASIGASGFTGGLLPADCTVTGAASSSGSLPVSAPGATVTENLSITCTTSSLGVDFDGDTFIDEDGFSAGPKQYDPAGNEDGAGVNSCSDNIDNGTDGFDETDTDCQANPASGEHVQAPGFPVSCSGLVDDDFDGVVNDGCPAVDDDGDYLLCGLAGFTPSMACFNEDAAFLLPSVCVSNVLNVNQTHVSDTSADTTTPYVHPQTGPALLLTPNGVPDNNEKITCKTFILERTFSPTFSMDQDEAVVPSDEIVKPTTNDCLLTQPCEQYLQFTEPAGGPLAGTLITMPGATTATPTLLSHFNYYITRGNADPFGMGTIPNGTKVGQVDFTVSIKVGTGTAACATVVSGTTYLKDGALPAGAGEGPDQVGGTLAILTDLTKWPTNIEQYPVFKALDPNGTAYPGGAPVWARLVGTAPIGAGIAVNEIVFNMGTQGWGHLLITGDPAGPPTQPATCAALVAATDFFGETGTDDTTPYRDLRTCQVIKGGTTTFPNLSDWHTTAALFTRADTGQQKLLLDPNVCTANNDVSVTKSDNLAPDVPSDVVTTLPVSIVITNGIVPANVAASISVVGPAICNPLLVPEEQDGVGPVEPPIDGLDTDGSLKSVDVLTGPIVAGGQQSTTLNWTALSMTASQVRTVQRSYTVDCPLGGPYNMFVVVNASSPFPDPNINNNQAQNHPVIVSTDNDLDNDGVLNNVDNCPSVANPTQANADGDALGDVCDTDDDNDLILDVNDNCDTAAEDADGIDDADGCPDTDSAIKYVIKLASYPVDVSTNNIKNVRVGVANQGNIVADLEVTLLIRSDVGVCEAHWVPVAGDGSVEDNIGGVLHSQLTVILDNVLPGEVREVNRNYTVHCIDKSFHDNAIRFEVGVAPVYPVAEEIQGGAETLCNDALDNDNDGRVNDGCVQVGSFPESAVNGCTNAIDEVDEDPAAGPAFGDDTVVNDGCPVADIDNVYKQNIDITAWAISDVKKLGLIIPDPDMQVGVDLPVVVRSVFHNNGPFGPTDVLDDITAIPANDCSINGAANGASVAINDTLVTLPVSVTVTLDQSFVLNCDAPSFHTFTWNDSITVSSEHVRDPNPNNNSATISITNPVYAPADAYVASVVTTSPVSIAAGTNFNVSVAAQLGCGGLGCPVNGTVALSLSVPPDCTKVPAGSQSQAVSVGFPLVTKTWLVNCSNPSNHQMDGSAVLTVNLPLHVSDPNTENSNVGGTDMTVVNRVEDKDLTSIIAQQEPVHADLDGIALLEDRLAADPGDANNDSASVTVVPAVPGTSYEFFARIATLAVTNTSAYNINVNTTTSNCTSANNNNYPEAPETAGTVNVVKAAVQATNNGSPCYLTIVATLTGGAGHITDVDGIQTMTDQVVLCPDADNDGVSTGGTINGNCQNDNCPTTPNAGQQDSDGDGIGDACDSTPNHDDGVKYCLKFGPAPINLSDNGGSYMWVLCEIGNFTGHDDSVVISNTLSAGILGGSLSPLDADGCGSSTVLLIPGRVDFVLLKAEQKFVLIRTKFECHSPATQQVVPITVTLSINHVQAPPDGDDLNTSNDSVSITQNVVVGPPPPP